ncbi:MAG: TetR family transcriptional regulator [Novosphingobium sp.]
MAKAAAQLEAAGAETGRPVPSDLQGDAENLSHNLAGQRLGRKGRDTRDRIIAAAVELIYCSPVDPLTLSAVARQAKLGMTSLYNYFGDLPGLLLALLDPVMATAQDGYLGILRERWSDDELGERCYEFVAAYQDFWARHTRLLHLRNSLSDGGDQRMADQRINTTQPIIRRICEQMGGDPRARRSSEFAMATVLMIGLERSITIATDRELPSLMAQDIQHDRDHFLRPCARLMEMAIRDMRGA